MKRLLPEPGASAPASQGLWSKQRPQHVRSHVGLISWTRRPHKPVFLCTEPRLSWRAWGLEISSHIFVPLLLSTKCVYGFDTVPGRCLEGSGDSRCGEAHAHALHGFLRRSVFPGMDRAGLCLRISQKPLCCALREETALLGSVIVSILLCL